MNGKRGCGVYIYIVEYYLYIKKEKRMKFCHLQQHGWTWRVLCYVKQVRQILYDIIYMWNLKITTNK